MLEQQLVDYIKKARETGQSDEQSRAILYKSGWLEAEINDALAVLDSAKSSVEQLGGQVQQQAQPQPAKAQINVTEQPKMQPQAQPQPQLAKSPEVQLGGQATMPRVRKSHTIIKLFMVLIIVIVLGGVGLYVGGQYINLPWNPFWPNPETVINKMLTNMKDVKSSHMVLQGEVDITDADKTSIGKLSLTLNGGGDMIDANNIKGDYAFSISILTPIYPDDALSANINIVNIDNKSYLKINNIIIPDSVFGSDILSVMGQWMEIDETSLATLLQAQGEQIPIQSIDILQNNNQEPIKKIQDLLLVENILSVNKQLGDEAISGQNTYHYLLTISKDKLKDLFAKITALQSSNGAESNPLITGMMGVFADTIGDIDLEMWIGKKDSMLYQVKFDKSIELSKVYPGLSVIKIKATTINSDFNKPVTVVAPEGSQKIEEIILPLFKTQGVRSNLGQINYISQSIFQVDNNYSALCYRGLLNGYNKIHGATLLQIAKELIGQKAKNPSCFADVRGYCISTQLNDGSYLCIGELGVIGTTKCVDSTTVCQ